MEMRLMKLKKQLRHKKELVINIKQNMTKNEIVAAIYDCPKYNTMLNNICKSKLYKDDLKQELFVILLDMEDDLIIRLHSENNLIKWANRILTNQHHSSKSPFYKKYKHPVVNLSNQVDHATYISPANGNTMREEIYTNEDIIDELNILQYVKEAKILTWAEMELFIFYYRLDKSFMDELIDKRSYRSIAKEFGLSLRVVQKTIDSIRYKIINQLKSDANYSHLVSSEYEKSIFNKINK